MIHVQYMVGRRWIAYLRNAFSDTCTGILLEDFDFDLQALLIYGLF